MKKYICITSFLAILHCADAMDVESYKEIADKFSEDTDLINGYILLESTLLKSHRFYGPASYNQENACSFEDTANDGNPVMALLIQLFPSVGVSFNASGTGSLEAKCDRQHLPKLIATMFRIANTIRGDTRDIKCVQVNGSEINVIEHSKKQSTELVRYFFDYIENNSSYYGDYNKLIINIANSVLAEQDKSYPPLFTNYMISAYACSVLQKDLIKELAEELRRQLALKSYKSELTELIFDKITNIRSMVPFLPGQYVISNSIVCLGNNKFPDCVETMLRQLFATIFCNTAGIPVGKLGIDPLRIPKESPLLEFFAPKDTTVNIRELANDGSPTIRSQWAKIVSNHQESGIQYINESYNLRSGWDNVIALFCLLMKEYKAIRSTNEEAFKRQQIAEETIKGINQAVQKGDSILNDKQKTVDVLNKLFGIRTDVELVAERRNECGKQDDKFNEILVYPKNNKHNNILTFCCLDGHAQLLGIPNDNNNPNNPDFTKPWIEQLYLYGNFTATSGKQIQTEYFSYNKAKYKLLEYCSRLGIGYSIENLSKTIVEALELKKNISGVAHFLLQTENNVCEIIKNFPNTENNIECLSKILDYANNPNNANNQSYTLITIDKLLSFNNEKAQKFNKSISEDPSYENVLIQKFCFGQHDAFNSFFCKQLQNITPQNEPEKAFETLYEFYKIYELYREYPTKLTPFREETFNCLIPYIISITEQLSNNCNITDKEKDIVDMLFGIYCISDLENVPKELLSLSKVAERKIRSHYVCIDLLYKGCDDRYEKKLDFLVPIAVYVKKDIVEDILSKNKQLTLQMASSLIMLLNAPINDILKNTVIEKGTQISKIIQETIWCCSDTYSMIRILEAIADKYGKFDTAVFREAMNRIRGTNGEIVYDPSCLTGKLLADKAEVPLDVIMPMTAYLPANCVDSFIDLICERNTKISAADRQALNNLRNPQ